MTPAPHSPAPCWRAARSTDACLAPEGRAGHRRGDAAARAMPPKAELMSGQGQTRLARSRENSRASQEKP